MGLFDFLKGGKTEEKAPPKEAPAKPKEKPHAPERTAESLQAEQMRLLRGTAILNGERLKTLRPERITEDLRRIDKARGLADFELKLAEKESEKKQLEKWKLGLGLLAGMYRAQTRENQGCGMKKPTPKKYSGACTPEPMESSEGYQDPGAPSGSARSSSTSSRSFCTSAFVQT